MTPARTSSCTTSFSKGWRSWLGVKSDFLDWHCQTNGRFDPMPLPHLHWRFPWTCLLCGTAEAQKGWDTVRAGCPPEHSRTEWERRTLGYGWMDQDSWGLCPSPLWDSVLWYLPVGSWDSWHMKLRVIASWTSWERWASCMRVVLHGQLSQALEK